MRFLSIDIGGTYTKLGIVDNTGKVFFFRRILTKTFFPTDDLSKFSALLKNYLIAEKIPTKNIQAIVVGLPCTLTTSRNRAVSCPNLKVIENLDLIAELNNEFAIPIFLERDTNLAILGECWKGAAKGYSNVVGVFVGTGLGCGLILNGRLYVGSHGVAAELGHIAVPGKKDVCACGNVGCVELYASGVALRRNIERDQDSCKRPAKLPKTIVNSLQEYLAWAIGTIVTIFDPEIVVLGGGMLRSGLFNFDLLKTHILRYTRKPEPAGSVQIKLSRLGDKAALVGGGRYALDKINTSI